MEFAEEGGEGATPYEVLLHAAMEGNSTRFTRQDGVEEPWRVMQPLLDSPAARSALRAGVWGPADADKLVAGHGRWHDPWIAGQEAEHTTSSSSAPAPAAGRWPTPGALGQAHPAAGTRRLAAAGAAELGRPDVFADNRYVSEDTWFDAAGKPFQPQVHYFVGGATKLYGAALYRLRTEDFGELHHPDGVSPAWPISYDDIEPYYTRAERMYQVHGARGEDPTEPPASAPYPLPAVSHEPRIQELADDLAAAGYHPFHAPCGVLLARPHAVQHLRALPDCDGFPCPVHAKSDAEVLGVRPALEHPNVTLLTNARLSSRRTRRHTP